MMEQTYTVECHYHVVVVSCLNNEVVANASAWLNYAGYAALAGTLNVVTKWEEGI